MTATVQTTLANLAPRPFRFAMLVPTIMVDVVAPIGILKTLEWLGVSPMWALAGGCVAPVLNNLRVWMMSRRLDPVGILMIGSIASGTVASLVAGNIFYKIITDCILNSAWGLAFLGSLFFRRPLIFFIIRQLVAGEDASRTEIWNGLWRYAAFRLTMRSITATWAAVYFAELLIEVAFARILSPETVATFSPLMGVVATLALIVFTRQRMRMARTRIELDEHLKWPL